jgi:hypothetical protein
MDETDLTLDTKCAHCSAWCKGKAGVSLHFLTDHILDFFPFCISDDNLTMKIFRKRQLECFFCLNDASAGAHTKCRKNFAKAAKVMARNLVSSYFFSSQTSVLPSSSN